MDTEAMNDLIMDLKGRLERPGDLVPIERATVEELIEVVVELGDSRWKFERLEKTLALSQLDTARCEATLRDRDPTYSEVALRALRQTRDRLQVERDAAVAAADAANLMSEEYVREIVRLRAENRALKPADDPA